MDNLNNKDKKMPIQQKSKVKVKSPVLEKISVAVMMLAGIVLAAGLLLPFLIPDKNISTTKTNIIPEQNEITDDLIIGSANPAAIYCIDLGYDYGIKDEAAGQIGICTMPNNTTCEEWDFLKGTCGQQYSYCALNGYDLQVKEDGQNSYSGRYAVCVSKSTKEVVGSVTDLFSMDEKATNNFVTLDIANNDQDVQPTDKSLPSKFDWSNNDGINWMTPVKQQGSCGSCWAYGVMGAIEGMYNIKSNNPNLDLNLSEEYVISDCHGYEAGGKSYQTCCRGGRSALFDFIRDQGIVDEQCMPEQSRYDCSCENGCSSETCQYCSDTTCSNSTCSDKCSEWQQRRFSIGQTQSVTANVNSIKQALIDYGPLSAGMGIFSSAEGDFEYIDSNYVYKCGIDNKINHFITIVGYDDTIGDGVWIVKNSYGDRWGMENNGYLKVGYGECGIEQVVISISPSCTSFVKYYKDADADGFGDPAISLADCSVPDGFYIPDGYVNNSNDCDDTDPDINPGAVEICDEIDNNCNQNIDEGLIYNCYPDNDNDLFGNTEAPIQQCGTSSNCPAGFTQIYGDCNDTNPNINPGMEEICANGIDDNCNNLIDTEEDADNDGYSACNTPADCNDNSVNINPGEIENCFNGRDDDCNGEIDEDQSSCICENQGGQCVTIRDNQCVGIDNIILENYVPNFDLACSSSGKTCCTPKATGGID